MRHLRYLVRRKDGMFWSNINRFAKEYQGDIIPVFESLDVSELALLVHPDDIGRMGAILTRYGHDAEFIPVEFTADIAPLRPPVPIVVNNGSTSQ